MGTRVVGKVGKGGKQPLHYRCFSVKRNVFFVF